MAERHSILFVHYGRGLGGAPKSLRYAVQACMAAGYDCTVACLGCAETNPYFAESGARVVVVGALPFYSYRSPGSPAPARDQVRRERAFASEFAPRWRAFLGEHGPFALVFLNSMVLCDLIRPSQEAGCRVIQAVRETTAPGAGLAGMKTLVDRADAVLFISEHDRALFSLTSTRTAVVGNSEDPAPYHRSLDQRRELRTEHGFQDEDVVLVFTGGDSYIKGGSTLLESLLRVTCRQRVVAILAGYADSASRGGVKVSAKRLLGRFVDSPRFNAERMEVLLERVGKRRGVEVRRVEYRRDICEYFVLADICVVPFRVAHQARPIFEAGMAKLPCLVSDFACFREEVTHGENGYLLPSASPEAWARAIAELADNPGRRQQMGARNHEKALERHDPAKNGPLLQELVAGVLKSTEGASR